MDILSTEHQTKNCTSSKHSKSQNQKVQNYMIQSLLKKNIFLNMFNIFEYFII